MIQDGTGPMDPREFGAAGLARAIRGGEFTVTEVVESHIDLIEEVNPGLNAVVTTMFESAIIASSALTSSLDAERVWKTVLP